MKKFTFFIASLLVAIGAMAQTTTIDVAKTYTLECQSESAHNTTRFIGVTDGVINGQSATGAEITFEAAGDNYYIKVDGKYINYNGSALVASTEASTAWVLGTVENLVTFMVPETTLYLNNNQEGAQDGGDGTVTNLKANNHPSGPTTANACSTWAMVEYVAPEEGGEEEVNEFENKMIASIGAAATSIEAEQWYVLYNQARGCYVSEETTSFRMRDTGNLIVNNDATEKAGYLFQFEATGNENEYYIMSGNGLYFSITQGSSNVSTTPVAYTIAQIGDNAGHFYGQMVSDGRVLDGNANGGTLAGWDTTVPSGTGGNNDYQFLPVTLTEKAEIDYPNALTEFNPNKCYTATVKVRGGWAVNSEGEFVSYSQAGEVADANKQFAVLSADNENYYLFNVGANAFVKKDGTTVQGIADPIVLHDASAEGECRVLVQFKGYNDGYINLNGESNMDICDWGNVDHGNAIAFIEAGDFNPEAALAMLSNAATVTYTFVHEGKTIATQTATVNKGEAYPAINATFPYGVTATVPEGVVEGSTEKTIEVEVSKELPFVAASDAASITNWYYVRMHSNEPGFIGNIAEDNTINVGSYYVATSADTKENHLWGFVGNVFDGIKVVNKGTGKMLTSTGVGNVTLTDEGTALFIDETEAPGKMNATDGFCLRNPEATNFINANYSAGKLSHWSARDAGSTFMVIEPTESLDVEITAAGYATYYWNLPAYIPEGVQAFVVNELNGTHAIMSEITGTIPANTGVILKGNATTHSFAVAHYATAANGNKLKGTNATTDIDAAENTTYYVLANGEDGIGLYPAKINDGKFHNNANKAYLPVIVESGSAAASYSFNFDWAGTTGIDGVVAEGAESGAIYDITGRRVKAITAPGIYIVNGKKVVK